MKRSQSHGHAGFSLVELLVTVVIAGIVFAALVPMFIQTTSAGSRDRSRLVALEVAQDKIEKIRQLDFQGITQANLDSSTFWNGAFANPVVTSGGKPYDVTYTVADGDAIPGITGVPYKTVTVSVTWTPPPSPAVTVAQKIVVYPQWAGPRLLSLTESPIIAAGDTKYKGWGAPYPDEYASEQWVTLWQSSPCVVTASIDNADVPQMTMGTLKGYVLIAIKGPLGYTLPTQKIVTPNATYPYQYQYSWAWNPPSGTRVTDGLYTFTASAYSYKGFVGTPITNQVRVETGAPAAVTNLTAAPNDGAISLSWTPVSTGDFDTYEVWRGGTKIAPATGKLTNPSFSESGLTNGTAYTYTVYALDQLDNRSSGTTVTVTPAVQVGPAPNPPTNLHAIASYDSLQLAWTGSTTPGVTNYIVYKYNAATPLVPTITSLGGNISTTATFYQDYGQTEYYQVVAQKTGCADSAFASLSSPLGALTGATQADQVYGTDHWLKVSVTASSATFTRYVKNGVAKGTITLVSVNPDGSVKTTYATSGSINKNGTTSGVFWTSLPPGRYQVILNTDPAKVYGPNATFYITPASTATQTWNIP